MASDLLFLELLEKKDKLQKRIAEQSYILRILKKHAKVIDTYGGVYDKPVPYCDINIMVYDEDPDIEDIKAWLEKDEEEDEDDYQVC